jgi:tryptophan-rich sensory protein
MKDNIVKLILAICIPLLVGGVAGAFTADSVTGWYQNLNSPSFRPPDWIFGPVWITLYILMGFSSYLIWKMPRTTQRDQALLISAIQLFINFIWSFLFFYFKNIGLALVDIILLWITILLMGYAFYKKRPLAAYINVPYFLWVSFAAILNYYYFILN